MPPTNYGQRFYDLKTGLPPVDPAKETHQGTTTGYLSFLDRRKDLSPSSFSPRTGLLDIPAHDTCMDYGGMKANYIAGTPYLGTDMKMETGPG